MLYVIKQKMFSYRRRKHRNPYSDNRYMIINATANRRVKLGHLNVMEMQPFKQQLRICTERKFVS
jgi:hypothetical protein